METLDEGIVFVVLASCSWSWLIILYIRSSYVKNKEKMQCQNKFISNIEEKRNAHPVSDLSVQMLFSFRIWQFLFIL